MKTMVIIIEKLTNIKISRFLQDLAILTLKIINIEIFAKSIGIIFFAVFAK